jgi:hypothetical protein
VSSLSTEPPAAVAVANCSAPKRGGQHHFSKPPQPAARQAVPPVRAAPHGPGRGEGYLLSRPPEGFQLSCSRSLYQQPSSRGRSRSRPRARARSSRHKNPVLDRSFATTFEVAAVEMPGLRLATSPKRLLGQLHVCKRLAPIICNVPSSLPAAALPALASTLPKDESAAAHPRPTAGHRKRAESLCWNLHSSVAGVQRSGMPSDTPSRTRHCTGNAFGPWNDRQLIAGLATSVP